MNKIDPHPVKSRVLRRPRRAAWLAVVAAGCGAAMPVTAQLPAADEAAHLEASDAASAAPEAVWAEGDTVRDLLRADAQAARAAPPPRQAADWLEAPAGGAPRASAGPADEASAADRIDVMAIYGVGKALHADISVNGRVARYRAGRAAPLASAPLAGDSYALQAIEVPCVRLRKAGAPYTACLLQSGSVHD
ncbi:hypothetical protein [Bordetella petrii]|uniref:hypothetical protein n=1 Tax=Bordetella petrii TaxID=94624 RepID=UPI001F604628|nr:hypothetical protein [Bordetella petrii]